MADNEEKFSSFWTTLNEGIPKAALSHWQERISARYRESQRYYHTLQHVLDMKLQKEQFCSHLKNEKLVDYAIIFHDVIYDPKQQNNEEESAALFEEFASEIEMPKADRQLVMEWILLTKTHSTPEHQQQSHHIRDEHYLLDLDMAILGSPPHVYQEYAANIRKEYAHVPHRDYCTRRAQLLKVFLQTPQIFATSVFYKLYEEHARSNINQEIHQLLQAQKDSNDA